MTARQWIPLDTAVDVTRELEHLRWENDLLQRDVDAKDAENLDLHKLLREAEAAHASEIAALRARVRRLERGTR